MHPRKVAAIVLVLLSVVVIYRLRRHSAHAPVLRTASGQHSLATDFSLTDLSGHPLTLSQYRGTVVLLDFWATWCEPCRQEIPHFIDLQNKYGSQGVQIIGISMDDDPQPVRDFYQEFKMNYPVVMGTAKVAEQYGGVLGLPVAFVIGRNGRIYSKHVGAADLKALEKEITGLLQNGS
jgi:cytochrome c biogenesis protein CcmG/thiol:disulfide interchange protein DsbE